MAGNNIVKTYSVEGGGYSQTFTAPGGVKSIILALFKSAPRHGGNFAGDSRIELNDAGDAYAFGVNTNGQLGDSSVAAKSSPVLVVGSLKFQKVATSGTHSIGLDFYGRAWCWGINGNGQLGDATVVAKSSPVQVVGSLTFKDVCVGASISGGITTDGRAWCWGINTNGQLGDASVVPKSSPVLVVGGLRFKQLVGGNAMFIGLTEAGAAYAFGLNTNGELGDASVTPRSSPVAVVGSLTFVAVGCGTGASALMGLGLTAAGALYCWGGNNWGGLGDGTTTDRSSPVAVVGALTFKDFACGEASIIALTTAGAAYCWGSNNGGQAGQNSTTSLQYSSPVAVVGSLTFVAVAASFGAGGNARKATHYGITAAGAMWSWGDNSDGQQGTANVTSRSSPVQVVGSLTFRPRLYLGGGSFAVSVTPNTSYTLDFSGPYFTFGGVPYGTDIFKAEVRYQA